MTIERKRNALFKPGLIDLEAQKWVTGANHMDAERLNDRDRQYVGMRKSEH